MPVHSSQSATGASIVIDSGHGPSIFAADALVQPDPRVEVRAVLAAPLDVTLDRDQRIERLPRRTHRRDQLAQTVRARGAAHLVEHAARETLPLAIGTDRDRERRARPARVALERAEERLVPAARDFVLLASVPCGRDGVELGDELVAVEQRELEVGKSS